MLLSIVVAASVFAPPNPHSVTGYIFLSDGTTAVSSGTWFLVNNTNTTGEYIEDVTNHPIFINRYAVSIIAEDGDYGYTISRNDTYYGRTDFVFLGNLDDINVFLNISRIEQNVTFNQPPDDSLKYLNMPFNVSVNITAYGGDDNVNCNATLTILSPLVLSFYGAETALHTIPSITTGSTHNESWELVGDDFGSSDLFVEVVCENQTDFGRDNTDTLSNVTIIQYPAPYIETITLEDDSNVFPDDILLEPGTTKRLWCNGTANDPNGYGNLLNISGVIFGNTTTYAGSLDNNNYYTDSDCSTATFAVDGTFSCAFDVQFFADYGDWMCIVNVTNLQSVHNNSNDTSYVNEMLAISINNTSKYFGVLKKGSDTGTSDFTDVVYNEGNVDFDIQVDTDNGTQDSDYSMNCSVGNLPVSSIRVALAPGIDINSRLYPPAVGTLFLDLNQTKQTNPLGTLPTTRNLYWGATIPVGTHTGTCTGYVRYIAQASS